MINFSELSIGQDGVWGTEKWNGLVEWVGALPISENFEENTVRIGTSFPNTKLQIDGTVRGNQSGGTLKIQGDRGYMDIGPKNSSYAHFYTDRPSFYFNNELRVDSGKIGSFNEDLRLCTSGSVKMTVRTNGRVGIGTNAPSQQLHVMGGRIRLQKPGTTKYIDVRTDGAANDITSYNADLYLAASNSEKKVVINNQLRLKNMPYGNFKNVQWNSSTGILGYDNSSRRFKENIRDLEQDFETILLAQPKTYTRPGDPGRLEIGFIAEEFHDLGLFPLIDYDEEGLPESLHYEKMVTYMLPIMAKQKEKIETLEQELKALTYDVSQLNLSGSNRRGMHS